MCGDKELSCSGCRKQGSNICCKIALLPSAIHIASQHQVVLLALPPNTTHLAQPLDKGIFGPLKVEWRKLCHEVHHCESTVTMSIVFPDDPVHLCIGVNIRYPILSFMPR